VLKDEDFVHAKLNLSSAPHQNALKEIAHEVTLAKRSFHEVNHENQVETPIVKTDDQGKKSNEKETVKETQSKKGPKSSKSKANETTKPKESEHQAVAQEVERKTSMVTTESQPRKDSLKQTANQTEVKQANGSSKKVKENTSKPSKSNGHEDAHHQMITEPIVIVDDNKAVEAIDQPHVEVALVTEEVKPKAPAAKKPKKQNDQVPAEKKTAEDQEAKAKKAPKPKKEKSEKPATQENIEQPEQVAQATQNEPAKTKPVTKKTEPNKTEQLNGNQANQVPQPQAQIAEKKESPKNQKEPKKQSTKPDSAPKPAKETPKPVQDVEQPKPKQSPAVLQKSKTQPIKKKDSSDEEIFDDLMKQPKINPALTVAAKHPVEQVEIKNVDPSEDEDDNEVVNSFEIEVSSDDQNDEEDIEGANFLDSSDEQELEDSDLDIKKKPVNKPSFGKQKGK